ncbi:MAG: hypothetical protein ACNI3A_12170 [Desulfovibrio sp.]|uniref:hypothetical protein n=1 Tax=Desulfovibrio sp. 7SRBS1 TaxID=3378064 RepID=UPI003B3D01B6
MSGIGGALSGLTGLAGSIFDYNRSSNAANQSQGYYDQMASAAQAQTGLSQKQAQLAREQWDRYQSLYGPLEEDMAREYRSDMGLYRPLKQAQVTDAVKDISLYRPLKEAVVNDSLDRMARLRPVEEALTQEALEGVNPDIPGAMGRASANVRSSFAKEREAGHRKAESLGLDPAMTEYMDRLAGLDATAAEASARTLAAEREQDRARDQTQALRSAVLGLGSTPSTYYSGGLRTPSYSLPSDTSDDAMRLYSAAASGLGNAAGRYASLGSQLGSLSDARLRSGYGLLNNALSSFSW